VGEQETAPPAAATRNGLATPTEAEQLRGARPPYGARSQLIVGGIGGAVFRRGGNYTLADGFFIQ